MSAQNIIPNKIVDGGIVQRPPIKHNGNNSHFTALGFLMLLISIIIMSSVLIYMCLTQTAGESVLLLGVAPFLAMFVILLLSK